MALIFGLFIAVVVLCLAFFIVDFQDSLEDEDKAKIRKRVSRRYLTNERFKGGFYAAKEKGFYIFYYLGRDGRLVFLKKPAALVRRVLIDEYDLPYIEIRQELMHFPSGRVDVSRELYTLYIQKDRIRSGLLALEGVGG